MSVKFDVNACLEAAMRANPNASREFLTRALSQTLTQAGQKTEQKDVNASFDAARARVGATYRGAPLHVNPAVRLQARIPTIVGGHYVKSQDESGNPDVLASDFGTDLEFALRERGGLGVNHIFTVSKSSDETYCKESGSLIVRVDVDGEGNVTVLDILENEPGKEAAVRKAFAGLSLPKDSILPGAYDLQIGFASNSDVS
jgi:hypothetical protein